MNEIFPYKLRKYQKETMEIILNCLRNKENLILEAPAGIGKTICSLVPSIYFAKENDMGIVYLTRTNSQQKQAIIELKKIAERIKIKAVSLQGKINMCPLVKIFEENISNEEMAKFCSARKKRSLEALKGKEEWNRCIFFENFLLYRDFIKLNGVISAEETYDYSQKRKICAYEINKMLVKSADIVIAPYIYIFDEFLREKFFSLFTYKPEETILIIDEAHNLPDFCRELLSFSLSMKTIKSAIKECNEYGIKDRDIINFLFYLQEIFNKIEKSLEKSEKEDDILPPEFLKEIKEKELKEIANKMLVYGEVVSDIKESKNILPRSFIKSIGNFFISWLLLNEKWVRIVEREEDNLKIGAYCLEPSIASSILNSFYCSLHMSATIQPMNEYKDSLGIRARLVKFPSPFPKENRKILYVKGITTKYYMEEEMVEKIKNYIEKICNSFQKNILVLFPSYVIMNRFLNRLNIKRKLYIEKRKERQESIMEKIREFKEMGGIFLSVMGGRLAEGIDFPSEELEIVIIVGIPYPPPSARQQALQKYYDEKFENGWKYVMEANALRKIMQAIGRLIRNENDRGIVIIMDERAKRFKKYIEMEEGKDIVKEIKSFWK